jgi:putative membrane protein
MNGAEGELRMFGYGMMHGYGLGLWGGLIGLILNVLIIVGIIWLVVWAVRRLAGGVSHWGPSSASQSPREILQMRYARGEITRDQYQEMLKDLS